MLVTSYLPVISLIARGCVLCGLLDVLFGLQLPRHTLLGVACAAVFWDHYAHRSVRVSVLCGARRANVSCFCDTVVGGSGHPDSMHGRPSWLPLAYRIFVMACISDASLGVKCAFTALLPSASARIAPRTILWTALSNYGCCVTVSRCWTSRTYCALLCHMHACAVRHALSPSRRPRHAPHGHYSPLHALSPRALLRCDGISASVLCSIVKGVLQNKSGLRLHFPVHCRCCRHFRNLDKAQTPAVQAAARALLGSTRRCWSSCVAQRHRKAAVLPRRIFEKHDVNHAYQYTDSLDSLSIVPMRK